MEYLDASLLFVLHVQPSFYLEIPFLYSLILNRPLYQMDLYFRPSTSMCHDDGPDTSQKEGPKDRSSVIRTASMEDDLSLGAEGK